VAETLLRRFGRVVRRRREAAGVSQETLAELAGLHRTYVSHLECGKRNPSLSVIAKLAAGLETSMASLVAEVEARGR
jgi:transcriptional regulator with XRE-family HTH domain